MFVVFDGIDGSGKTSQAGLISKWLNDKDVPHLLTKEPGTVLSKECQQIRQLLLSPDNDLSSRTELLLYLADRAQHVDKCIKPALEAGEWVISDRYSWSTFVYQGVGRDLLNTEPLFRDLVSFAAGRLWPDLTFIMDLPVEIGLKRAKSSNVEFKGGDRMEREAVEFHEKLRKGFLDVAMCYPEQCVVLNAEKSIEELHEEVKEVLSKYV